MLARIDARAPCQFVDKKGRKCTGELSTHGDVHRFGEGMSTKKARGHYVRPAELKGDDDMHAEIIKQLEQMEVL